MSLGPLTDAVTAATDEAMALVPRMWERDHTVWGDEPTEITDRLGWLDAPERAASTVGDLVRLASKVVDDGITDVLVVGMGGSSLYPEVLVRTFGPVAGSPRLRVLDSTDPAVVLKVEEELPWQTTLLVAASKSGGTVETISHLDRFLDRLVDVHGDRAGEHVVVITDPGSDLDARSVDQGFREVVHGQPDVGGRYAALTPFGLLPAALLGLDLDQHLAPARDQLDAARSPDPQVNGPAVLGAVLAAAARTGRDKLTLLLPDELAAFGLWVEQLVAESTGKHGLGILPVLGELPGTAQFGADRLVVALGEHEAVASLGQQGVPVVQSPFAGASHLAGEVVRWEVATAIACALLGINAFDQPDVAAAKAATSQVLASGDDLPPTSDPMEVLDTLTPGTDYVALLGFVPPDSDAEAELHATADRIRGRFGVPVTVGVGPRYLHSTGQLHKGGPNTGVFLVLVGDDPQDAEIPGQSYSFSRLKRAQAAGDIQALRDAGRRVVHVGASDLAEL